MAFAAPAENTKNRIPMIRPCVFNSAIIPFPGTKCQRARVPRPGRLSNGLPISGEGRQVTADDSTAGAARRPSFISKAARPRLGNRRRRADRPSLHRLVRQQQAALQSLRCPPRARRSRSHRVRREQAGHRVRTTSHSCIPPPPKSRTARTTIALIRLGTNPFRNDYGHYGHYGLGRCNCRSARDGVDCAPWS